jgi:hypothetical protein
MLVAGGGQVMRMGFWQNKGMTSPDLSAAMIAEHIDDVIDMSKAAEVKVGMIGQG